MSESNVMKSAMLALSKAGAVVFRQNVGQAVIGEYEWIRGAPKRVMLFPGDCVVRKARVFHAGVKGMADLGGWFSITITPEMVGRKVALYLAPEVKDKGGRATPDQLNFRDQVLAAGGIAGIIRSDDEAVALLAEFRA